MSDFILYDDNGASFGPTYPELCLSLDVVPYNGATPQRYDQDRLITPDAPRRSNPCVGIRDHDTHGAAIPAASSYVGNDFHHVLQPPRPGNLPSICRLCGNAHLTSPQANLSPFPNLGLQGTAALSLCHVPNSPYINPPPFASSTSNAFTHTPTPSQPHAAQQSTSPLLSAVMSRGATSATQSGFNVIAYGDVDPLRGQRRNETEADSIRRADIEEAGGSCQACRTGKQQCDGDTPCRRCAKRFAREQKKKKQPQDQPSGHARMSPLSELRSQSISVWADQLLLSRFLNPSFHIVVMPASGGKPEFFAADNPNLSDIAFDVSAFADTLISDVDQMIKPNEYPVEAIPVYKHSLSVITFLVSKVYASLQESALARNVLGLILEHMLRSLHDAINTLYAVIASNASPVAGCFRPAASKRICRAIILHHRISKSLQALDFQGPLRDLLFPFQQGVMSDLFSLAHPGGSCKHGELLAGHALSFDQWVQQNCPELPRVSSAKIGLGSSPHDIETSKARRGSTVFDEQPIEVALLLGKDPGHATVPDVLGDIAGGTASSSRSSTGFTLGTTNDPLLGIGNGMKTPTWEDATDRTIDDKSVDMSESETALTTSADISTIVSAEMGDTLEHELEMASQRLDNDSSTLKAESGEQKIPPDSEFRIVPKRKKRSTGSCSISPDRKRQQYEPVFDNPFTPLYDEPSSM